MGRKEMEAVGMGCLFVDPLLQWFLISLRRNSNVNMTARLCTCVLYHCLHPLAPHTALPLLWALGHQPSFCSLSSLLSAWRRAKRLSPVSVPSPTQQPLARTGHSLSFTWGTVQQVLYLPFFNTVCEPLGSEVTSVLLLAAAEEEALCEGPKSEGVAGRTKVAGSHFWGVG